MPDVGRCYECVVACVDDKFAGLEDPKTFHDTLMSDPWNHKLKNVEEPRHHLGGDFFRDKDGTYCCGAQTQTVSAASRDCSKPGPASSYFVTTIDSTSPVNFSHVVDQKMIARCNRNA